eukprot:gene30866-35910_t
MGSCASSPEGKEKGFDSIAPPPANAAAAVKSTPPQENASEANTAPKTTAAPATEELAPAAPAAASEPNGASAAAASPNGAPADAEPRPDNAMNSMKSLNKKDAATVQETLVKVSQLIQRFSEGRSERTTPVHALKRALDLFVADCGAKVASVFSISEERDVALLIAFMGAGAEPYTEKNWLQLLKDDKVALRVMLDEKKDYMTWDSGGKTEAPEDWQQLASLCSLGFISAIAIKMSDTWIGVLTIGFTEGTGPPDNFIWPTYLQLISSSLSPMIKGNSIPKYLALAKDIHESPDLDSLVHHMMHHYRTVLGHTNNQHVWYRVALTSQSHSAATIFDDLSQVPGQAGVGSKGGSGSGGGSINGSGSHRLLKEVHAAGGILRTVVSMKNTVMKISVHNRQQVMIPDVQKLMNQSGNVSTDLFNRLVKPPTSVLVFPLKVKQNIFGVIFCMSTVESDFSDVASKLREVCEIISPHLLHALTHQLQSEYQPLSEYQNAKPNGESSINMSFSRDGNSGMGSGIGLGNSISDSFIFKQSCSSTGALVAGLTEKLNQKRIKSSMEFEGSGALLDLQVNHLLGEGGFAKVFRGLWRGLVVGIKVVCDDGTNDKMVMKNAHEIAILSALSHPNIVQAYTCMTDVLVRDLVATSFRNATPQVLSSPAYKYLLSMDERPCHIELLANLALSAFRGLPDPPQGEDPGPNKGRINMRTLTLTLIEISSAMADLHRMGVVHCDLKPANVL